jgi:20S proteasome alpha/beta subunit
MIKMPPSSPTAELLDVEARNPQIDTPPDPLVRKMNSMTILVGMVGSDGIIIAADKKAVQSGDSRLVAEINTDEKHKAVFAWAGDSVTQSVR